MDAVIVNSEFIEKKLHILKCRATSNTINWFKEEFYGISCCNIKSDMYEEDYQLLIYLLSYYKDKDYNPKSISDCPGCTPIISKNCPTLPKILELI